MKRAGNVAAEHGRAYIKILFMMTQWELGRTSVRVMLKSIMGSQCMKRASQMRCHHRPAMCSQIG